MQKLIIFIGPPAGGKTTTAKLLADRLGNSRVIEVDQIKEQLSGSVFPKKDEERELWFQEVNRQIKKGLAEFDHVIVDEGFFDQKYLNKILIRVESESRTIIKIMYDLNTHLKRDANRPGGGNTEAVTKNYNNFIDIKESDKINADLSISDPNLSQEEILQLIIKS